MINFFDKTFYLIYRQYEKWGENSPYDFAVGILTVFQVFLTYDFLVILSFIDLFPKKIESAKYLGLIIAIILYLYNQSQYNKEHTVIIRKYDEISKTKNNNIRNKLITYLIIILSIIFPIIIGILRHNYGILL